MAEVLLGRALANAFDDTAKVDEAQLIIGVLKVLDAPHIHALQRMRAAQKGFDAQDVDISVWPRMKEPLSPASDTSPLRCGLALMLPLLGYPAARNIRSSFEPRPRAQERGAGVGNQPGMREIRTAMTSSLALCTCEIVGKDSGPYIKQDRTSELSHVRWRVGSAGGSGTVQGEYRRMTWWQTLLVATVPVLLTLVSTNWAETRRRTQDAAEGQGSRGPREAAGTRATRRGPGRMADRQDASAQGPDDLRASPLELHD